MTYSISPDQVESITDHEMAVGTDRLLPSEHVIPRTFWDGNLYTRIIDALFAGTPMPHCDIVFLDEFQPSKVLRAVKAHLRFAGTEHQHRIAGVAYLLSCTAEADPREDPPTV